MFYDTNAFNQPLGDWDVSSVTDMNSIFYNANEFNQPLNNWNPSLEYNDDNEIYKYI